MLGGNGRTLLARVSTVHSYTHILGGFSSVVQEDDPFPCCLCNKVSWIASCLACLPEVTWDMGGSNLRPFRVGYSCSCF